jgi:ferredoxin
MASVEDKYEENITGTYYVDLECISCDTCTMVAKQFFKLTEDCDHAFVVKQPQTTHELSVCEQALDACPVNAIGNDG